MIGLTKARAFPHRDCLTVQCTWCNMIRRKSIRMLKWVLIGTVTLKYFAWGQYNSYSLNVGCTHVRIYTVYAHTYIHTYSTYCTYSIYCVISLCSQECYYDMEQRTVSSAWFTAITELNTHTHTHTHTHHFSSFLPSVMYAPGNIYWHKWENSKEKYHLTLWSFENWSKTCCAEPSKVWKARSNLCPTAGPGIEHPRLRDSDNRTARLTLFYPSFKDFTLSCTLQHANRYTLISCTYTHQYEVEQCQHWPPGYSYTHLYFVTCIKAVEKWHDHITELRSNYRYVRMAHFTQQ